MPKHDNIQIRQLAIEINGGCNYKCEMCPQATGREKSFLKKLPIDTFAKVVDDAEQYGLEVVSLHGSGEPTLNSNMAQYVEYVKNKGLQCISLTNGYRLTPDMSKSLIKAGIDMVRVSAVGYDRETYKKWMSQDAFELVREHVIKFRETNEQLGGNSEIQLYHIITDIDALEYELEQYKRNWVEWTGSNAEI